MRTATIPRYNPPVPYVPPPSPEQRDRILSAFLMLLLYRMPVTGAQLQRVRPAPPVVGLLENVGRIERALEGARRLRERLYSANHASDSSSRSQYAKAVRSRVVASWKTLS